jgi:hypothetical protein
LGFLRIVRYAIPLRLEFPDRGRELRNRGADIGQFDDVGFRLRGQFPEFSKVVTVFLFGFKDSGNAARIRPAREMSRVSTAIPADWVNVLTIGSRE